MDDIVIQAMAKWPNVPHCYGWLALDARGNWRMRDEAAQRANTAGDKLTNAALVGFINRNYLADEQGNWYFQNGPQRVYINLEATPFIARTEPQGGLRLHTGQTWARPEQAWLTNTGALVLRCGQQIAQLDDRDLAPLLATLLLDGQPPGDEALLAWMEHGQGQGRGQLQLPWQDAVLSVEHLDAATLAQRFAFQPTPRQP